ncbi:hypothetical protein HI030_04040 [Staphylococcus haemolyticus]|nr:hypothetical protein HI030_04040 [Staphylococcus haemolyticus]
MQNDGTIGYSIKKAGKKISLYIGRIREKKSELHMLFLSRVENNKANPSDELLKKNCWRFRSF